MLLADLKTQAAKDSFVNLAFLVAKADGNLGYAERELINLYLEELEMRQNQVDLHPIALSQLCDHFPSQHAKQVVYANLLSLAMVDGLDSEGKRSILDIIQENLAITATDARKYEDELKLIHGSYIPNYID